MNLEDEYGIRHEWHYGTSETQRRRSIRVQKALTKAGVPGVLRQPRMWFDDPKTMVWAVSFPERHLALAELVTDRLMDG